jgi:hypothetical protein
MISSPKRIKHGTAGFIRVYPLKARQTGKQIAWSEDGPVFHVASTESAYSDIREDLSMLPGWDSLRAFL